ncbi:hypothetical protein TNCV_4093111 [Trichonephila clavipes]|nr:hypothetical protein TNCV_4093111 [Trichonephila clavipes]
MYIQDRFGSYRSIEWTKTDWNCTRYSIITYVRTRQTFRWGKRRIRQIPFVVNNNRADVKTTVEILRDRRPPITCFAQTSDSLARLTQTLARMPDVMDMRERNIK